MYTDDDKWDALRDRLVASLHYVHSLTQEDLYLFLPYIIQHDRERVIARLIKPRDLNIPHDWDSSFTTTNEAKILRATTTGRVKNQGAKEHAKIFVEIEKFEKTPDIFKITNFEQQFRNIRTNATDQDDFEWDDLDDTYPVALMAKAFAGEVTGLLCRLVVTLVYRSLRREDEATWRTARTDLGRYLASLEHHKIMAAPAVAKVKSVKSLNSSDWNLFRTCYTHDEYYTKSEYDFHHLRHGGDTENANWETVKSHFERTVWELLVASYDTDNLKSTCTCQAPNRWCRDQVLGYPLDKPSIRELLQWDGRGRSLTRVLMTGSPPVTVLGEIQNDYCWVNPHSVSAFVNGVSGLIDAFKENHPNEFDPAVPNAEPFQGAYIYEVAGADVAHAGLWLCISIAGLLSCKEWADIRGRPFSKVLEGARSAGFRDFFRVDWEDKNGVLRRNVWKIDERFQLWATTLDFEATYGVCIYRQLPCSGLAAFIKARRASDHRACWEVDIP